MRMLFLTIFLALVVASIATALFLPETASTAPILYWVTEDSPARREQIRLFRAWLRKHGHGDIDLRLDTTTTDETKKIIQGVSGVGADVMEISGGGAMRYFNAIGLLADVTQSAREMGFDPSVTYAAARTEIMSEDSDGEMRQYSFPDHVYPPMFFVNRETLLKHGQPIPPTRWDVNEFERLGLQFVKAANPPGQPRRCFYADTVDLPILRRSYGVAEFNETQTRCTLDDPRHAEALKLIYRWQKQLHLIPSRADEVSFTLESGQGDVSTRLFASGNYAQLFAGLLLVSDFRQLNIARVTAGQKPLDLTVVGPPHVQFPTTGLWCNTFAVYAGSKNADLAKYVLAFLASEDYSLQLLRDGNTCPPNATFSGREEYLCPSQNPELGIYAQTEWDVHSVFLQAMNTIAVSQSYSPFVLQRVVLREDARARSLFLEGQVSAEQAIRIVTERLNAEIQHTLADNPKLWKRYEELVAVQQRIDDRRRAGEKVPREWIKDPFHRAYYQSKGWAQ